MRQRIVMVALALAVYVFAAPRQPWGVWDAFSMWNLRAKMIALRDDAIDRWRDYGAHPEYPPTVPIVIGGIWRVTGDVSPTVPIVLHGMVYGAIVWVVSRRGWRAGLLVAACGLGFALMQYADTPLALALLCAMVAWQAGRWGWMGAALGVGMLVKNEGVLMAAAVAAVVAAGMLFDRHDWLIRRRMLRAVPGLLVGGLLALAWKTWVDVPNDLTGAAGMVERLTDGARWGVVLPLLADGALRWRTGGLLVAAALAGAGRWRVWRRGLLACGMVISGYVLIYAITPHDVGWHISTSWDRLLWQVFPAIVWTINEEKAGR